MVVAAAVKESIEANTGPLELIQGSEYGHPLAESVRIRQAGDGVFEEEISEMVGQESVRLVDEIDQGFGGVVPSGVFKIKVADGSIGLAEGIVKSEIGR